MNPTLRNILAIILGILVGMLANGGLVTIGTHIFPYPDGIDSNNMEQLKRLFNDAPLKFYIFPFLAHAIGTLVGAFIACKIAASHHKIIGLGIGMLFLIMGILVNYMIQGPLWFIALDILIAYIPMGFLGWRLAK